MPAQKYYEGQEFHNPNDASAPVLVYKAGKFVAKPVYSGPAVTPDSIQAGQEMLRSIDTARKQASPFSTGTIGGTTTLIPASPSHDLERTVDTIKGNLSLDKLMQMKANSPNGASGLGSLTENEARMLASVAGSLDVGQNTGQFRDNLANVRRHIMQSTPGVNIDVPLDLSGGQSREQIPRSAYYRDPQGNIRRNDNGDKGNPILRAPGALQQAPKPSPASALKPGHVEDGHVYVGGPPGDPNSWQKVR